MTRRLPFSLSRLIAVAAISASTFVPAISTANDEFDSIVADDYEAELCGWGPYDTCPLEADNVEQRSSATSPSPRGTIDTLNESLAAAATAACATAGISVEQIVEPFAMVGPQISKSLESVNRFQQWWADAATAQQNITADADPVVDDTAPQSIDHPVEVSHVPIVDFDSEIRVSEPWAENLASAADSVAIDEFQVADAVQLAPSFRDEHCYFDEDHFDETNDDEMREQLSTLAIEEPLDVLDNFSSAFGPSIVVDSVDEIENPIANEQSDTFVGSSAMIVSIEEPYLPYDLPVRDYQADSLYALAKRPFCIRARIELPEIDLANDLYESDSHTAPADSDFIMSGSADCLLDDWVWKATLALESGGSIRQWLRPELAGRQMAAAAAKQTQVASELADRLAKLWPPNPIEPASATGSQLLARAGAIESKAPQVDPQQLAQAAATLKQLVSAVESATTNLRNQWLQRLARLSPDQDTSQRR